MNQKEAEVKEDGESSLATSPPVTTALPIYDPNMTTFWPPSPPPPQPPYYYPPMPMAPPPGPYYFPPFPPPFYNQPAMGMGGYDPYNADRSLTPLTNAWSTQLCDCFSDIKISFITIFLPCVTFGRIAEFINEGHTTWWEHALMFAFCHVLTLSQGSSIYSCYYRTKMRNKYALNGNIFMDFLLHLFCMRLSLCQQYRQLDRMGFDVGLGWHGYMEKQRINATEAAIQFMPPRMDYGMYR
ncbi:PREDICTED: protein PLANT CADMIUM RESISTANCE 2-like [Ipomoea nil]|uniref:protein PLANT CADMIUM RESISTANCE 2-like n=1 Tax=Ipomoea nil TaxID=35883 RepID=UPI0009018D5C|nr:PREDICTED: protein PLANT CADMIUM RESISTANCE 2-like [Ipomoea nil]